MKSLKLSAAETWRLSKIEEETDSISNPSSPFKQHSTHSTPKPPHQTTATKTTCNGNQHDDDGYEKVPKSREEWEAVKRQAVKAEEAVKAFKSKYDSLEKARKPLSNEQASSVAASSLETPPFHNHLTSLSLTHQPPDTDAMDWADIPLPPPHILNNTIPSPDTSMDTPSHTLSSPSQSSVNSASPHVSKHQTNASPNINDQKQQQYKNQQQRQSLQQQNHKQQQQQQQTRTQHQQQQKQLSKQKQQQQQQQHQQNHTQQQLTPTQQQQNPIQQQHMLSPHELLQMETFYRGLKTEVFVCTCTATLLRRIIHLPTPSPANKPSTTPIISSPITTETEWKLLKEGVPVFVLDSGESRRQKRLQLVLAERGTGFSLWKDSIDHLSTYQSASDRLHTLQASHDHSCLLALLFSHPPSASSFLQTFQLLTSSNHDILQISKKKKKKQPPQAKVIIRKTDISQPCCFTHITKIESVDSPKQ